MNFEITDSLKIKDIQQEFNKHFPFLKLEFFSKPHKINEGSSKEFMYSPELTIKECRKIHNDGEYYINSNNTVSNLEQAMQKIFGLNVQVFKKFGNVWIETSITDNWTLAKQNEEAEQYNNATGEIESSLRNLLEGK